MFRIPVADLSASLLRQFTKKRTNKTVSATLCILYFFHPRLLLYTEKNFLHLVKFLITGFHAFACKALLRPNSFCNLVADDNRLRFRCPLMLPMRRWDLLQIYFNFYP